MSDTNIFSAIYKGMKTNVAILLKRRRSRSRYGVKTSEKANMHNDWPTAFSPFGRY